MWSVSLNDKGVFLKAHGAYVCGPYPDVLAAIIHSAYLAATLSKITLIPANN